MDGEQSGASWWGGGNANAGPTPAATTISSGANIAPPLYGNMAVADQQLPLSSYRRLQNVLENQTQAREARQQREERKMFAQHAKEKMRQRGMMLKHAAKEQARTNTKIIRGVQHEKFKMGAEERDAAARGREKIAEKQRQITAEGAAAIAAEHEREERKRAAIALRQAQQSRDGAVMRADLQEQKEVVDATNLANNRSLVARVRADTAHDKIRLAKTSFIDQRWDRADMLREELAQWKARRRDQELQYLAGAVMVHQQLNYADESARLAKQYKIEQQAAEVRHNREEFRRVHEERKAITRAAIEASHAAMTTPQVALDEDDEMVHQLTGAVAPSRAAYIPAGGGGSAGGSPSRGAGGGGGGPIDFLGKMFGFRSTPAHSRAPSRGSSRFTTPHQTPRSARSVPGGGDEQQAARV